MHITYRLLTILLFIGGIAGTVTAQNRIEGSVIDAATHEPIVGATISVPERKTGTLTDFNGAFLIDAPSLPTVLKVNFVGYREQQVDVYDNSEAIVIELSEDAHYLNEVVVTGVAQGTTRKSLSFALTKIGDERLNAVPATDASTTLRGKVAGIRIDQSAGNESAKVYLRGAKSVSGNIEPLIVIDGFVTSLSLSDIAPSDIETIEVVKGAAASALYGTRGEGGVIQVITKKGKGDKVSVVFDNELGTTHAINIPKTSQYHHFKLNADGSFALVAGNRTIDYQDNGFSVNLHPYTSDYDNVSSVLSNQLYYNNTLSISGSGEKYNFYASLQNQSKGGVTDAIDPDTRQSVLFNYGYKPNSKVSLEFNSQYSVQNTPSTIENSASGIIYSTLLLEPFVHLNQKDANGNYLLLPDGMEYVGTQFANPLYEFTTQEYEYKTDNLLLGGRFKYAISDHFNAEASYSIQNTNYNTEQYYPIGYETISKNVKLNNGQYSRSTTRTQTRNGQVQLNYNQAIGDWTLGGALKSVYEYNYVTGFSASGYNLTAPVKSLDVTEAATRTISSTWEKTVNYGYFLNLKAGWKEKWFVDVLGRIDKSSRFGKDVGWAFFPRAAVAYRLSEDVKLGPVTELKLRAAYGQAGSLPAFGAKDSQVSLTSSGGVSFTQNDNTNLKRAITSETELGFDATLFDRINVQVNYAFSNSKNDFISVPSFTPTSGSATIYDNLGKVSSNSLELELSGNLIQKKRFSWDLGVTFSRVRSKIKSMGSVPDFTDGYYRRAVGLSTSNIWGFSIFRSLSQLETNEQGFVTNAGDGTMRVDDYTVNSMGFVVEKSKLGTKDEVPVFYVNDKTGNRKVIGDSQPDFVVGLTNTFRLGDFTIYASLDWKQGGDKFNETNNYLTYVWRSEFSDESARLGYPLNFTTSVFNQEQINDYWVEKTTYVALRELSVSYQLPLQKLALNKWIKKADVALVGRNLFILTGFKGVNVDAATSYDFFNYPSYRIISGKLTLTF
jgi:TonB-linked SusC/RagA family outer membrane protein